MVFTGAGGGEGSSADGENTNEEKINETTAECLLLLYYLCVSLRISFWNISGRLQEEEPHIIGAERANLKFEKKKCTKFKLKSAKINKNNRII